ncbi:preprotein translocase subunit SecE [Candidatus Saccharibacteria bacterium]|nr:preprotein translocase subunit SecE [Candidatus Saccharibacteria bacterium]
MAKKDISSEKTTDQPVVTRIKANDSRANKVKTIERKKPVSKATSEQNQRKMTDDKLSTERGGNVFVRFGRYVRGAWHELMEVRWPTRRATWSMTGAVLIFTAFFAVFILSLDALFNWLSQMVLN